MSVPLSGTFMQVTKFPLSSLLADPKARKVIVVEHPLLSLHIKEMIARILFENQVCIFP